MYGLCKHWHSSRAHRDCNKNFVDISATSMATIFRTVRQLKSTIIQVLLKYCHVLVWHCMLHNSTTEPCGLCRPWWKTVRVFLSYVVKSAGLLSCSSEGRSNVQNLHYHWIPHYLSQFWFLNFWKFVIQLWCTFLKCQISKA